MYYKNLLNKSKQHLTSNYISTNLGLSPNVFKNGAKWMHERLAELNGCPALPPSLAAYNYYGFLKYGICLVITGISVFLLSIISALLIPLGVIVFYSVEVQFLFLFPLLIDGVKRPLTTSIKQTSKIGTLRAVVNVLPIGIYMIFGLFDRKQPFNKWYIGCMSILIWYNDEVRNRL